MSTFQSVEPAIDPANKPTFLIDWELTLKCNLDCSYCPSGPEGGHWNATRHPSLEECKHSADFMFKYADLYMQHKKNWAKAVVLNVYGGESLYHPDIVKVFEYTEKVYSLGEYDWPLTITCTTNLVVKQNLLEKVIPFIDEFTVSYHAETSDKQKKLIRNNIDYLHSLGRKQKIIIMMHSDASYWPELLELIKYCEENEIKHLVKQIDGDKHSLYNKEQLDWFKCYYNSKSLSASKKLQKNLIATTLEDVSVPLASQGRACCGGRAMCVNENYKQPVNWIPDNNFHDWHCSVNWFFVYIKQYSKDVYVNKDCKMHFDGTIAPIGNLDNYQELLQVTEHNLNTNTMPTIQCKRSRCRCGLCAPKSLTKKGLHSIMKKHVTHDVFENK